jgi:hypothetical protein
LEPSPTPPGRREDTNNTATTTTMHRPLPKTDQQGSSICVEDLFFLADLEALGIPWVNAMAETCRSHEDVEAVRGVLRCWGPDEEDVEDARCLRSRVPEVHPEVERVRALVRLLGGQRP